MKKIFSSLTTALRTTPFLGRTFVVLTFFFLIVKQVLIVLWYGNQSSSSVDFWYNFNYILSDFLLIAIMILFVIFNKLFKKNIFKIINNTFLFLVFVLFVLDVFTMYFFQSRISILDMGQFLHPSFAGFSSVYISIFIGFVCLSIVCFLFIQSNFFKKYQKIFFVVYFILLLASATITITTHVTRWSILFPKNILSLNLWAIIHSQNTDLFASPPKEYKDFFVYTKWSNKRPNIVVVFAESLSPIDSLRIGGVNNNLSYFDIMQQKWITFTNFITNGGTSDTAHIGLFLWVEPLRLKIGETSSYYGYKTMTDPLPVFFAQQWYHPIFVSAVSLDFLNQRSFLDTIGFQTIIGEEAFEDKKKYVFDSAPDHDLYNKTLDIIQEQTWLYFLALQTISFHKPYDTPYGKTEKEALQYADKSLYYFYLQLKKANFFDNGLLIIVSDHRKMTPLEPGEQEALWDFWYTKWLATIIGTGIVPWSKNTKITQHTDIFYWLKKLVSSSTVTISSLYNELFSRTKRRERWLSKSRYYTNTYTLVWWSTWAQGKTFDTISQIYSTDPLLYNYLSSYMWFQYGSWFISSWDDRLKIIWHRWSPTYETENSLAWFFLAKEQWADGIEFDVSRTKDKKNVVMHWESLYPTICGANKKVTEYTLAQLQSECPLTNKEPVRTLKDMLSAIDGLFEYYFLEIKVYNPKSARAQTEDAIATVKSLRMEDRVIFISYDETAKSILGSTTWIIAWWDTFATGDFASLSGTNFSYVLMPHDILWSDIAADTQSMGKNFVTYTVNTTGEFEKLYKQGIRFVMTDDVPLIKERAK